LKHAEELLKARDAATAGKAAMFYAEVSRAMYKYLGDKLNIQQADMSIEAAVVALSTRSVNGELTASLKSFLESCEMARFAPTSVSVSTGQQTYDAAKTMIVELERVLRTR